LLSFLDILLNAPYSDIETFTSAGWSQSFTKEKNQREKKKTVGMMMSLAAKDNWGKTVFATT